MFVNDKKVVYPTEAGKLALTSDVEKVEAKIPDTSKMVTTDTAQTITGKKTLTDELLVQSQKGITVNNGESDFRVEITPQALTIVDY